MRKAILLIIILGVVLAFSQYYSNYRAQQRSMNVFKRISDLTSRQGISGEWRKIGHREGFYSHPRWSPDGKSVAFIFHSSTSWYDVWVMRSDGRAWKHITNRRWEEWIAKTKWLDPEAVEWMNRTTLTYVQRKLAPELGVIESIYAPLDSIFQVNLNERRKDIVMGSINSVSDMAWTPNGSQAAITFGRGKRHPKGTGADVYLFDRATLKKELLIENGGGVRWSPDGKRLAYVALRPFGVAVMDLASRKQLELVSYRGLRGFPDNLTWSPDGRWIAYRYGRYDQGHGIYVVPSDGSRSPEKIVEGPVYEIDWSPKGDTLLVSTFGMGNSLYLVDVPPKFRPQAKQ